MEKMKNVVSATTANGSKGNEMMMNENSKIQMAKMKSVENGEVKAEDVVNGEVNGESVANGAVKAEDVEVRIQKRVELKRGSMYYACSYNSCDTERLVLITCVEEKRDGKRMIDYVMVEPDKYIGENEKHEPLYTYKLHKYHKSSRFIGGADSLEIGEKVDGPNGVCVYHKLKIEDVKLRTIFGHGCLTLSNEMYDEWGEWLNSKVDIFGLTAILMLTSEDVIENEIIKHVEMLDENILSVKWLVDGEKRCDSLTAEVGYDDDGKLVFRAHDNLVERTGMANMVFSKADMQFTIDTKEKIKAAATFLKRAIQARR